MLALGIMEQHEGLEIRSPEDLIISKMTAEQKLNSAFLLYWHARDLKAAAIRAFNPGISDQDVAKQVRDIFLYART